MSQTTVNHLFLYSLNSRVVPYARGFPREIDLCREKKEKTAHGEGQSRLQLVHGFVNLEHVIPP